MIYNKKAQVSAPFELLVAIIVMTFVIIAGSYALSNLSENTCIGNKRQDMSNLTSSLREIVLGSDLTYRTINFNTKPCYDSNFEKIKLVVVTNEKERCERICGSGENCVLLEYSYENSAKFDYKHPIPPICTYLPTNVLFGTNIDCDISNNEKAIDPTKDIPIGYYKIYRLPSEGFSKVCMIKTR